MFVNRRTFVARRGCLQEAAVLLQTAVRKVDGLKEFRILLPKIAPFDVFVAGFEFEDWAEYEDVMARWTEVATPEFWEEWNRVTEPGGTNEVWGAME